jgi:tagatose-1,6-bisphosphate aldolase
MAAIGKTRGLARLADTDGHFRMVALDQRPPMFEAIAAAAELRNESVRILDRLSGLTKSEANSWAASYPKFDHVKQEGDFARAY